MLINFLLTSLALAAMPAVPVKQAFANGDGGQAIMFFRYGVCDNEQCEMAVAYTNGTNAKAKVTIEVYNANGELVEVPYVAVGGGVVKLSRETKELAPRASGVLKTSSKGLNSQRGWMRVVSDPPGAVRVVAHGHRGSNMDFTLYPVRGAKDQLVGPMSNGNSDQFLLANNSSEKDRVTLVARSRDGVELCRTSVEFEAAQYYRQYVKDYLPCTAGKSTTLEIHSETGGTAAMGFMYGEAGRITPLQPQVAGGVDQSGSIEQQVGDLLEKWRKRVGL